MLETDEANEMHECDDCGRVFHEDEGHLDEAGAWCGPCRKNFMAKQEAKWAWLQPHVTRHLSSCRLLDIPMDSSDLEVMAAARRLK